MSKWLALVAGALIVAHASADPLQAKSGLAGVAGSGGGTLIVDDDALRYIDKHGEQRYRIPWASILVADLFGGGIGSPHELIVVSRDLPTPPVFVFGATVNFKEVADMVQQIALKRDAARHHE